MKIYNRYTNKIIFDGSVSDLHGIDLRDADLRGADLRGADLRDVNLRGVNLRGTNLSFTNLRGIDLRGTNLSFTNLRGIDLPEHYNIPTIKDIHITIYNRCKDSDKFDMRSWCDTTMCRAGFTIDECGTLGHNLVDKIGYNAAAALIYQKSDPTLERVPDWSASNEDALENMKKLAEDS